jgi:hypothetical protein
MVVQETIFEGTIEANEVVTRLVAEEEPLGVLSEGLQGDLGEDLEIRREVLEPLAISQVDLDERTDFWTCWKLLHRFNDSRSITFDTDEMVIGRLDSRSAGTSLRLPQRADRY